MTMKRTLLLLIDALALVRVAVKPCKGERPLPPPGDEGIFLGGLQSGWAVLAWKLFHQASRKTLNASLEFSTSAVLSHSSSRYS